MVKFIKLSILRGNRMKSNLIVILTILALFLAACGPSVATQAPTEAPTEVVIPTIAPTEIPTEAPTEAPTPLSMDPVTVKFGLFPFSSFAPVYIADKEGFFAEQGITIEFVPFTVIQDSMAALASGQIDSTAGLIDVSSLNAIAQGANLKAVADQGYVDPQATCAYTTWVVRKDMLASGVLDDLSNLAGKKIISPKASLGEYALDKLLQQANLTLADIVPVELPIQNRVEAVVNGAVDISRMSEPWVTRSLATGSLESWQPWNSYMPDLQYGVYWFGPSIMDGKQDVGKRFMVALLKGIQQYNLGKTDRNVALMAELTKSETPEVVKSCWQAYRSDGSVNVQSILDFQKWAFDKGYMDKTLTETDIWDAQFINYANQILK
jgi:NitT/TauT family transport system substrate-binding protein